MEKGTFKEIIKFLKKEQLRNSPLGSTEERVNHYLKFTPVVSLTKEHFFFELVEVEGNDPQNFSKIKGERYKLYTQHGLRHGIVNSKASCIPESIIPDNAIFQLTRQIQKSNPRT